MKEAYPDIKIVTTCIDERLNEEQSIVHYLGWQIMAIATLTIVAREVLCSSVILFKTHLKLSECTAPQAWNHVNTNYLLESCSSVVISTFEAC